MASNFTSSKYSPTRENLAANVARLTALIKAGHTSVEVEIANRIIEIERWKEFRKTTRTAGIIQFIECEIEALRRIVVIERR